MKDVVISIRTQSQARDLIDQAAKAQGLSRSSFMLAASTEKAQEVLLDQVLFRLDGKNFNDFSALVEAPFEQTAAFKKLMAVEPTWAKST